MVLIQCRIVARADCAAGKHKRDPNIQRPTSNVEMGSDRLSVISYRCSVGGFYKASLDFSVG